MAGTWVLIICFLPGHTLAGSWVRSGGARTWTRHCDFRRRQLLTTELDTHLVNFNLDGNVFGIYSPGAVSSACQGLSGSYTSSVALLLSSKQILPHSYYFHQVPSVLLMCLCSVQIIQGVSWCRIEKLWAMQSLRAEGWQIRGNLSLQLIKQLKQSYDMSSPHTKCQFTSTRYDEAQLVFHKAKMGG